MQFEPSKPSVEQQGDRSVDWREVDRRLSVIAKQRAALDAEEARWLRAAARVKIWREVGCVSLLDYLERRLGYGPRAAQDRVRVAIALDDLPALEAALANGMPYTAVRELTRVATRETEQDWIDKCRGASVHEVEQAVSGHRKGSRPDDPAEPDLRTRDLTFKELLPSTIALLRQARQQVQDERGIYLTDDDLLALAFGALIEGGPSTEERVARARFQVAMVVCERCEQGWQEAGGRRFAMERSEVERAKCDAQYIGALDGAPARATQDVAPRVRRFVFRRDGGKCSVPGCRSARSLELHHIVPRSSGGKHDPSNLIQLCDGCHTAHHRGHIEISGTAGKLVVNRRHQFTLPRDVDLEARVSETHGAVQAPRSVTTDACSANAPGADETIGASRHVGANELPAIGPVRDESCAHAGPIESTRSKFERAAIATQALDALVTLGFKRHEARTAVDTAVAHFRDAPIELASFLRFALSKSPHPRTG